MHYLTSKVANSSLYQTRFDDGYVVWTLLPWSEFKRLREARAIRGPSVDYDLEEFVYNKCVIYSSYDEQPTPDLDEEQQMLFVEDSRLEQRAGIISTVVKTILFFSGVTSPIRAIEQLNQHRSLINNVEDQLTVAICKAFPAYKPEDIENMDWQTVLKRAAQAESILMGRVIEPPFRIDNGEEERKAVAKQKFDLQKELADLAQMEMQDGDASRRDRSRQAAELRAKYFREKGISG
jgi:hypothetical protein